MMRNVASRWEKSIPDLYPTLDNFQWKDKDPSSNDELPFPYVMILFGTPSGYFFLHNWEIMTVGADLEKFMDGFLEGKHWSSDDEGRWEGILDDTEAEIKGRNAK